VIRLKDEHIIEIRSTDIRQGKQDMLPQSIQEYVATHDLYRVDARSELRYAHSNFPRLEDVVHLKKDVIFTIRESTLNRLSHRSSDADIYQHDEWRQLLGLKMSNEEKLHLVIFADDNEPLGDRALELLSDHQNVYLGWSSRLPKEATTIHFERLEVVEAPWTTIPESKHRKNIHAYFDVFEEAFMAALIFALRDPEGDPRAGKQPKVIDQASAMTLGLLEKFFSAYAIISSSA